MNIKEEPEEYVEPISQYNMEWRNYKKEFEENENIVVKREECGAEDEIDIEDKPVCQDVALMDHGHIKSELDLSPEEKNAENVVQNGDEESDGEQLSSQTRETIAMVYGFLERDAKQIIRLASDPQWRSRPGSQILVSNLTEHLNDSRRRTAVAVGVSEIAITNILAEARESGFKFKLPYKNKKKQAKKK